MLALFSIINVRFLAGRGLWCRFSMKTYCHISDVVYSLTCHHLDVLKEKNEDNGRSEFTAINVNFGNPDHVCVCSRLQTRNVSHVDIARRLLPWTRPHRGSPESSPTNFTWACGDWDFNSSRLSRVMVSTDGQENFNSAGGLGGVNSLVGAILLLVGIFAQTILANYKYL